MQSSNSSPHQNTTATTTTTNNNTQATVTTPNYLAQQQQQQAFQILQQQQQQQTLLNPIQLSNTMIANGQQPQQPQQTTATSQKDTTFTKIFVGGLPYHTTDQSLKQFFQKFGNIEEAVVITDRTTGKSRGYGFVTMETKEAAALAVYDPNPIIDGRKANVNLAYLGVKTRVAQTAGFIPVSIGRSIGYPLQTTAAFGYPHVYCPPNLQAAAAQLHAAAAYQTTSVATPSPSSFLLQASQANPSGAYASPATAAAVAAAVAAGNPNVQATGLLDFAAFEQQSQQQQQQQQQQQMNAANGYIQAAGAFNLMSSGATSPQTAAATATPNFFAIPPPHHLVNVNSFQSH